MFFTLAIAIKGSSGRGRRWMEFLDPHRFHAVRIFRLAECRHFPGRRALRAARWSFRGLIRCGRRRQEHIGLRGARLARFDLDANGLDGRLGGEVSRLSVTIVSIARASLEGAATATRRLKLRWSLSPNDSIMSPATSPRS